MNDSADALYLQSLRDGDASLKYLPSPEEEALESTPLQATGEALKTIGEAIHENVIRPVGKAIGEALLQPAPGAGEQVPGELGAAAASEAAEVVGVPQAKTGAGMALVGAAGAVLPALGMAKKAAAAARGEVATEAALKLRERLKVAATDPGTQEAFRKHLGNFTDMITAARRGPALHDADVLEMADESRFTLSSLLEAPPGTILPAEVTEAAKRVYKSGSRGMRNAAELYVVDPTDENARVLLQSIVEMSTATTKMTGLYAEGGRTMRILNQRVPVQGGPRGVLAVEEQEVRIKDDYVNQMMEFFQGLEQEQRTTPGGFNLGQIARQILMLETPDQMAVYTKHLAKPNGWDAYTEAWLNGLLSGLAPIKNLIGNPAILAGQIINRGIAAGIDSVSVNFVRFMTGAPAQRSTYFAEVPAMLTGVTESFADSIRVGWKAFMENQPQMMGRSFEDYKPSALSGYLELSGPAGRAVDFLNTASGRTLLFGDEAAKVWAHRAEQYASAVRLAYNTVQTEKLTGVAAINRIQAIKRDVMMNPQNYPLVDAEAKEFARYVTLQQELGTAGQAVQTAANTAKLGDFPIGRFIMPFTTIPANVPKMAGEHTALAFLSKSVREEIAAGGHRRNLALAKISSGSMFAATFAGLAANGLITGSGPRSRAGREMLTDAGWQPYSIWDAANQRYVSYAAMEPYATIMGATADLVHMLANADPPEDQDRVQAGIEALVMTLSHTMSSKSYLQGMMGAANAVLSGDINTMNEFIQKQLPSLLIPYSGAVREFRKGHDPVVREVQGIVDELMNSIPGLSAKLPAHRNAWGEPIIRNGSVGPNMWNPYYSGKVGFDPVSKKLIDNQILFGRIPNDVFGIKLNAQQYDTLQQLATDGMKERIGAAIEDAKSPVEMDRIVHAIVAQAHNNAKSAFLELPEAEDVAAKVQQIRTLQQEGVPTKPSPYLPGRFTQETRQRQLGIGINE